MILNNIMSRPYRLLYLTTKMLAGDTSGREGCVVGLHDATSNLVSVMTFLVAHGIRPNMGRVPMDTVL